MRKINASSLTEMTWSSPGGKFGGAGKEISEALGRDPHLRPFPLRSTDRLVDDLSIDPSDIDDIPDKSPRGDGCELETAQT